jgi:hypothetical protein
VKRLALIALAALMLAGCCHMGMLLFPYGSPGCCDEYAPLNDGIPGHERWTDESKCIKGWRP